MKRFKVSIDSKEIQEDDVAHTFSAVSLAHTTLAACLSAKNYNVTLRLACVET